MTFFQKLSKFMLFAFIMCLFAVLTAIPPATAEQNIKPQYHNQGVIGTSDRQWREANIQSIFSRDDDGNMDTYIPEDRVINLTTAAQFSTLSGAAAGQSVYQTAGGKVYVVDPYAILQSVTGIAPGSTTGYENFAGVSIFLPDASTYSGPAYDTEIRMVVTGATGFEALNSGLTTVSVWPYPGAGATTYGADTSVPQTLMTEYTTDGTVGSISNASGVSHWEINRPGEGVIFGLQDSEVSAYVRSKKVLN